MIEETLIKAFIQKEFLRDQGLGLEMVDNLIEQGIIDSLGIMRLLIYMERSFGIKVTDEELIPANFETIESISSFIRSKESKKTGKGAGYRPLVHMETARQEQ